MLIHKHLLQLANAASTDESRYAINSICVFPDGTVKATDGHILVEAKEFIRGDAKEYPVIEGIDVEHQPDGPVVLHRAAILDALRITPKTRTTLPILGNYMVLANGDGKYKLATTDLDTASIKYIRPIDGDFPDTEKLYEKHKRPLFRIALGAGV